MKSPLFLFFFFFSFKKEKKERKERKKRNLNSCSIKNKSEFSVEFFLFFILIFFGQTNQYQFLNSKSLSSSFL